MSDESALLRARIDNPADADVQRVRKEPEAKQVRSTPPCRSVLPVPASCS
jgi:hypothetical protein